MDKQEFDAVCSAIACGVSARQACETHGVTRSVLYEKLASDPILADQYARARQVGIDRMAEQTVDLAADMSIPSDHKRIMVDTQKWILSKLAPKKYGDKLEVSGDPERPVSINISKADSKL